MNLILNSKKFSIIKKLSKKKRKKAISRIQIEHIIKIELESFVSPSAIQHTYNLNSQRCIVDRLRRRFQPTKNHICEVKIKV